MRTTIIITDSRTKTVIRRGTQGRVFVLRMPVDTPPAPRPRRRPAMRQRWVSWI